MKKSGFFKKFFSFGFKDPQFSLGDQSWERPPIKKKQSNETLSPDLDKNEDHLRETFVVPINKDIIIRDFRIPALNKKALIIYLDGLVDRNTLNFAVLEPLMVLSSEKIATKDPVAALMEILIPGDQISNTKNYQEVVNGILDGNTALLIDSSPEALIIETKGWEHRAIGRPNNEPVIRGPQEGFSELFRANTASIRRYIKDPKLVTEIFRVGKRSSTILGIMYIQDVVNPKLVEEVKYRIQTIAQTTDFIPETGTLEEFLEDHPRSLIPQTLSTERPDLVAAHICDGRVGLMMSNSPYSIIIPSTFSIFIHAAEDYYLRWPFSNFLRILRTLGIFISLILPAFYIAVINFHQEMVPTDLLLAITASRERVPFPALIELLFMELSFELIREAGIRVPTVIGPTIGIVGALILGQAAVAASIVSPILIIIVAITALSSFVVPNYNASFTIRLLRFAFIFLAGFLGFFGIAFGLFLMTLHAVTLTSFGVPFLSPIVPYRSKNKDRIMRPFNFQAQYRPLYLRPLDWIRQQKVTRQWDHPKSLKPDAESEEE